MKHPDESDEAIEFMKRAAQLRIDSGMHTDQAIEEAIDCWQASLRRAQLLVRFHDWLRAEGKPTLHVSLFEAAAAKARR